MTTSPKIYQLFDIFAVIFVVTLILSNIASTKITAVGALVFDAGTILFPLAYIVGDVITEVYGYKKMRRLIYMGVGALVLTSFLFWIVQLLPPSAEWANQAPYETILGVVWRIVIASVLALFMGEIMNAYVMARMKISTKGKGLWVRMISSSAVGSLIDTVLFSLVAFWGTMPTSVLFQLIITVFCLKMAVEVSVSPLTLWLIVKVKAYEKIDTYEEPAKYLVN